MLNMTPPAFGSSVERDLLAHSFDTAADVAAVIDGRGLSASLLVTSGPYEFSLGGCAATVLCGVATNSDSPRERGASRGVGRFAMAKSDRRDLRLITC